MSERQYIDTAEALLSDNPVLSMIARGASSTWVEGFQAWVNDERKRGTEDGDMMVAVTRLLVLTHSSTIANVMKPAGFIAMAEAFKACIDAEYVEHAQKCRDHLQTLRARQ